MKRFTLKKIRAITQRRDRRIEGTKQESHHILWERHGLPVAREEDFEDSPRPRRLSQSSRRSKDPCLNEVLKLKLWFRTQASFLHWSEVRLEKS